MHHHISKSDFYQRAGAGESSTSAGPFPGNWLAARIAISHLISRCSFLEGQLSWASTHGSLSPTVSATLAWASLSLICISHAVLTAPLERSTCLIQRSLLSLKMRSRSSSSSFASNLLDLTMATSSGLMMQICLIMALSLCCKLVLVSGQVSAWHSARKSCIHGHGSCKSLVGWFCCFTSQVNSYGHCGTVSSPNHTFSWAGLNKRITSNSCTYFRL